MLVYQELDDWICNICPNSVQLQMHRGAPDFCLFTFYWEEANPDVVFFLSFQLCLLQVEEWCITVLTRKSLTGPQESCFKSTKKSTFLISSAVCYVHHPSYWACSIGKLYSYALIWDLSQSVSQKYNTNGISIRYTRQQKQTSWCVKWIVFHYLLKKCVQAVCKASAIVGLIRRCWLLSKKHSVGKP